METLVTVQIQRVKIGTEECKFILIQTRAALTKGLDMLPQTTLKKWENGRHISEQRRFFMVLTMSAYATKYRIIIFVLRL